MTKTKAMRGVNLGGWLVLEPWITPSLFEGTNAPDEFTYCDTADTSRFRKLSKHRKAFIGRQDFAWLAGQGIQAVRIPVGYWVFGDQSPYAGAIDYLDKAFGWAEEYGIKVLVCLHGVPGSQNGEMHSGRQGEIGWHTDPENILLSLVTIERLAKRYAGRPGLLGIELLNEPSKTIPKGTLRQYYKHGYRLVRTICGPRIWVVFSDCFQPRRWAWAMHWPFHRLAYLDNHQYQVFTPEDRELDPAGHVAKTGGPVSKLIKRLGRHRRLIIGEWSQALDKQSLKGLDSKAMQKAYDEYTNAQLKAYNRADAWFYWTYKTEDAGPWSFWDCNNLHRRP